MIKFTKMLLAPCLGLFISAAASGNSPLPGSWDHTEFDVASPVKNGAIYQLISKHSGKCLDVLDHSRLPGTRLQQWECTGENHQKFIAVDTFNGRIELRTLTGMCLRVADGDFYNGAPVIQSYQCDDDASKVFVSLGFDNYYEFSFTHSGKCLDIAGPSQHNGAVAHQWDCHYGDNQQWYLNEVTAANQRKKYNIVSRLSGGCLDVTDHSTEDNTQLQQWSCTGEAHQEFRIVQGLFDQVFIRTIPTNKNILVEGDSLEDGAAVIQFHFPYRPRRSVAQRLVPVPGVAGTYEIRFLHTDKCLTIAGTYSNGLKAIQMECNGGQNQHWLLVDAGPLDSY